MNAQYNEAKRKKEANKFRFMVTELNYNKFIMSSLNSAKCTIISLKKYYLTTARAKRNGHKC